MTRESKTLSSPQRMSRIKEMFSKEKNNGPTRWVACWASSLSLQKEQWSREERFLRMQPISRELISNTLQRLSGRANNASSLRDGKCEFLRGHNPVCTLILLLRQPGNARHYYYQTHLPPHAKIFIMVISGYLDHGFFCLLLSAYLQAIIFLQ